MGVSRIAPIGGGTVQYASLLHPHRDGAPLLAAIATLYIFWLV